MKKVNWWLIIGGTILGLATVLVTAAGLSGVRYWPEFVKFLSDLSNTMQLYAFYLLVGLGILIFCFFFLIYKKRQRKKIKAIPFSAQVSDSPNLNEETGEEPIEIPKTKRIKRPINRQKIVVILAVLLGLTAVAGIILGVISSWSKITTFLGSIQWWIWPCVVFIVGLNICIKNRSALFGSHSNSNNASEKELNTNKILLEAQRRKNGKDNPLSRVSLKEREGVWFFVGVFLIVAALLWAIIGFGIVGYRDPVIRIHYPGIFLSVSFLLFWWTKRKPRKFVTGIAITFFLAGIGWLFFNHYSESVQIVTLHSYATENVVPKEKYDSVVYKTNEYQQQVAVQTQQGNQRYQALQNRYDSAVTKIAQFQIGNDQATARVSQIQEQHLALKKQFDSVLQVGVQDKLALSKKETALKENESRRQVLLQELGFAEKKLDSLSQEKRKTEQKFTEAESALRFAKQELAASSGKTLRDTSSIILASLLLIAAIIVLLRLHNLKKGETEKRWVRPAQGIAAVLIVFAILSLGWGVSYLVTPSKIVHAEEREKRKAAHHAADSTEKKWQLKLADTLKDLAEVLPAPAQIIVTDTALVTKLKAAENRGDSLQRLVTKKPSTGKSQDKNPVVVHRGSGKYSLPKSQVIIGQPRKNPGKYSLPLGQ